MAEKRGTTVKGAPEGSGPMVGGNAGMAEKSEIPDRKCAVCAKWKDSPMPNCARCMELEKQNATLTAEREQIGRNAASLIDQLEQASKSRDENYVWAERVETERDEWKRYYDECSEQNLEIGELNLKIASERDEADRKLEQLGPQVKSIMLERDEFERKGKDLCVAYGNALITIHDLTSERDEALRENELLKAAHDVLDNALVAKMELVKSLKKELECPICYGKGAVDNGGVLPWGEGIDVKCGACAGTGNLSPQDMFDETEKLKAQLACHEAMVNAEEWNASIVDGGPGYWARRLNKLITLRSKPQKEEGNG